MAPSVLGSQSIALLRLPSGTLIDFAGTVEPCGWLFCDGRELLKTSPTYAPSLTNSKKSIISITDHGSISAGTGVSIDTTGGSFWISAEL